MPTSHKCTGQVTLFSTREGLQKSDPQDVHFLLERADDQTLRLHGFTPVVLEDIQVNIGTKLVPIYVNNTLTVTVPKDGSGKVDAAQHQVKIAARFKFASSLVFAGTSLLRIEFDNLAEFAVPDGSVIKGSPLQAGHGALKLVAKGTFENDALNGDTCWVLADLDIAPPLA